MKHLVPLGVALVHLGACGGAPEGAGAHGGSSTISTGGGGGAPTSSSSSGGGTIADPNLDGPYQYAEVDDVIAAVPGGDSNVPVHCAHPTSGPSAGPYPVVVVGHGLQIAASEYYAYVKRLASFGYVALTVDFSASLLSVNNPAQAKDVIAGIDWAASKTAFSPDTSNVGLTGHSLGGKVALLAATMDPRVKATIVLDPVDGGGPQGCNPPDCVTVAALMPGLHIPTGFLGETTDAMGGFMPCAPAASNYTTFYANTNPPSLEVTVLGANHVSFVDDPATCGLACSFCQMATAPQMQVHDMALAYVTAFYERHLRGDAAYDTYLTGAAAEARYMTTGQATITSK
jgi:hypothetical protein